jgi:16S rRNA (uracil1498-N3)-methyltransferase
MAGGEGTAVKKLTRDSISPGPRIPPKIVQNPAMSSESSGAPRFWVEGALAQGAEIELPPAASRHVVVLRLREGDAITLFNGSGGEHEARLLRIVRDRAYARIGAHRSVERESPLEITLALGISSGDRMDYAVQKATELGVFRIAPLATERSVVRLSAERAERRVAHWRGVAIAACEQCGRNRVPVIEPVRDLDQFIADTPAGLRLLLSPEGDKGLTDLQRAEDLTLLIGAEGGLSPRERERALKGGFVAVRFGPRILRTETAPVAVVAALQAVWGDC